MTQCATLRAGCGALAALALVLTTGCGAVDALAGPDIPAASTEVDPADTHAVDADAVERAASRNGTEAWQLYRLAHGVKMRLPKGTAGTRCRSGGCRKAENWRYQLPTGRFETVIWVEDYAKCVRGPGVGPIPFLREGIKKLEDDLFVQSSIITKRFQGLPGIKYDLFFTQNPGVVRRARVVMVGDVTVAVQLHGSDAHWEAMDRFLQRLFAGLDLQRRSGRTRTAGTPC